MKRISSKKLKILVEYFKGKGCIKWNPRVLALLISEKECRELKEIYENVRGIDVHSKLSTHRSEEFLPDNVAGETIRLDSTAKTISLKFLYERNYQKPKFSSYDYGILIIEGRPMILFSKFKLSKEVDRKKFSFSTVFLHESLHVVEYETGKKILLEKPGTSIKDLVTKLQILNDLPEAYKGFHSKLRLNRAKDDAWCIRVLWQKIMK